MKLKHVTIGGIYIPNTIIMSVYFRKSNSIKLIHSVFTNVYNILKSDDYEILRNLYFIGNRVEVIMTFEDDSVVKLMQEITDCDQCGSNQFFIKLSEALY